MKILQRYIYDTWLSTITHSVCFQWGHIFCQFCHPGWWSWNRYYICRRCLDGTGTDASHLIYIVIKIIIIIVLWPKLEVNLCSLSLFLFNSVQPLSISSPDLAYGRHHPLDRVGNVRSEIKFVLQYKSVVAEGNAILRRHNWKTKIL